MFEYLEYVWNGWGMREWLMLYINVASAYFLLYLYRRLQGM
jgi:hypothetical protein